MKIGYEVLEKSLMSENFVFSSFQKPNRVTKNAALCVEERHALTVSRQTGGVVRINYGISLLCEIMTDILWVALSLMTLISRVRCSELGVFDGPRLGWLIGETKGYAKQTFVVPKSSESSVNWCGGLIKQLCKHRRFHSAAYQCSKPVVHGGYAFDHERQDHSWSSDSWLNRSPCEWSVVITKRKTLKSILTNKYDGLYSPSSDGRQAVLFADDGSWRPSLRVPVPERNHPSWGRHDGSLHKTLPVLQNGAILKFLLIFPHDKIYMQNVGSVGLSYFWRAITS